MLYKEEFFSKVKKTAECWEWLGGLSKGYARLSKKNKRMPGHRAAWLIYNGSLNDDELVFHKCKNKGCVNPDHLQKTSFEERFWNKVIKGQSCWEWCANKSTQGYGKIFFNGKQERSHRVSWILKNGEIKDNLWVLHKCDNPPCVNPDHLFLGTNKDNQQDSVSKKRHWNVKKTHCRNGHEYNSKNTRHYNGHRTCRKCNMILARKKRKLTRQLLGSVLPKTHCPKGHEYNDKNTRFYNGHRSCRECSRLGAKEDRLRKRLYGLVSRRQAIP